MRHSVKKIKFKGGHDATQMQVRQLLKSFIKSGTMVSTQKRIKVLRTQIEIMIHKAKQNSQADRDFLTRNLTDREAIRILYESITPVFKDRVGGYVRMTKLLPRATDGTARARLEWVAPVVIEAVEKPQKKVKAAQPATKKAPISKSNKKVSEKK